MLLAIRQDPISISSTTVAALTHGDALGNPDIR